MCGRYTLTADLDQLQLRFGFEEKLPSYIARYNIAPTQEVLAVTNHGPGNHAQLMRWGLIPFWAKDTKIGSRMINARAETVMESPSFRQAFQRRRCLVLADSFYEWKKAAGARTPMRIMLKSGEPFGFAGLWETWRGPDGGEVRSCTIITTAPNSLMEPIHNRMPVILPREAEAQWLRGNGVDVSALRELLIPYSATEMEAYEVSTAVNSARYDAPDCVIPIG